MKWLKRNKTPSLLAQLLADYPPYIAPHNGDHNQLSDSQATDNLDYLLAHKNERIEYLRSLLSHFSIQLPPGMEHAQYKPLIESLYAWARTHWFPSVDPLVATREVWRTTNRQNDQIIYSVVMDTAIVLGELTIARRPAFQWALDLDPANIAQQMPTARRPVAQAPSQLHPGDSVNIDWEVLAASQLINLNSAANSAINLWLRVMEEALSGATEGVGFT